MNEKLTQNEQAEKCQNAEIQSGLDAIETPPVGLGDETCIDCDDIIPMARRKAYNSNKCIECMTLEETMVNR